jgi:hypothetical protein
VPAGIGEMSDLVDHQQLRTGIMAQTTAQGGVAVERAEIAQQLARAGEQDGISLDQRLMSDVLRDRRLACESRSNNPSLKRPICLGARRSKTTAEKVPVVDLAGARDEDSGALRAGSLRRYDRRAQ